MFADRERVVDPQVVLLLRRPGRLPVGEVGVERPRHALARARDQPLGVEGVDVERERLHVLGVEQAARDEVVVLREVVGEAVAHDQDDATLVAEEPAEREADEHHQDREVEDQVADLTEVAALGADRPLRRDHAVAPLLQGRGARGEHVGGRVLRLVRRVVRQAGEVAGRGGRGGAHRRGVDDRARHDAAHEGEHQQEIDRREPGRVVDREQPELVVDRGQLRVSVLPARGLQGVDAGLRDDRSGNRGQREQEQQDQGGPHRGHLAPGPARHLAQVQLAGPSLAAGVALGGVGVPLGPLALRLARGLVLADVVLPAHRDTSVELIRLIWSQVTAWSHQPVTSRTPTSTSIRPPIRVTQTWWRRMTPNAPSARR